jgi:hypothetical protein
MKQAIVSASRRLADGWVLSYLDGHNNPGFCGGPLVAMTDESDTMHLVGLVFGSRSSYRALEVEPGKCATVVMAENTGIVLATDIAYATALIDAAA